MTKSKYDLSSFLEGDLTHQQIWEDSRAECSEETCADFSSLAEKIGRYERKRSAGRRLLNASLGVAACFALVFGIVALSVGKKDAEYIQAFAPKGEILSLALPDSTVVVLQPGSALTYPDRFVNDSRKVFLNGTANFSVAKDPHKPFIVQTQYLDVEALGTKFCIMAYPNDYSVNATLLEGCIKVDVKADSVKSYILEPDSQLRYIPSDGSVVCQSVNAGRILSWDEGNSVFQDSSFLDVINEIERRYDVNVRYDDSFSSIKSFFLRLHPEDGLEDALDMVTELIGNATYSISGRTVRIDVKTF